MLDPKSPLAAAGIFAAGILVIGYSILDVNRSLRQNSEPVTEQQNQHINQQVQESERNVTATPAFRCSIPPADALDTPQRWQEDAVALNAAYTALMEQHVDYDEEDDLLDVFDISEAEPDLLFINPFGCQMDPLLWRELQDYAQSAPDSRLLEDHLLAAGLSMTSSAIAWLTPAQLLTVQKELERMEEQLSFETTAWWLSDVLMRARVTNSRMSRAGANRW
ncbi:hypothetical protein WJX82_004406 [Trebouxia sp. C0006]